MTSPRISCDFNKAIDETTYGLNTVGSRADLARLPYPAGPGMAITLCDEDLDDERRPTWLLTDAVLVELPTGELVARKTGAGFRHEPRESPLGDTHVADTLFTELRQALKEAGWAERPLRFRVADLPEFDLAGAEQWVREAAEEGYRNVRYILMPQCSGDIVVDLAAHSDRTGSAGIDYDAV